MASMPTRVDRELFETAKAAGRLQSRSAAQQIDHWARIGRELEFSPSVTLDAVARVLRGDASYDDLGDDEAQAMVRAGWREGLEERVASLDLASQLEEAGVPWAEADDDGRLVVLGPEPPPE